ncbi:MAG: acyl carrier protein [Candidatus Dormibacteria bacterium]
MSESSPANPTPTTLDFAEMQSLAADILGVDPDQVQLDVSFAKDLAADSLDIVELIMAIEDRYQVSLPEEKLEHMKKVGDLWTFLLAHPAAADL